MAQFLSMDELFEGRHFDREIIVLCVRWYLHLVEMMAERSLSMAHTTIMRWVHHYAPEFERRWNRFARPAGPSWRVDETYVKIRGMWAHLYRAVDREGKTVDFRLSTRRDVAALDGYAASHRAVREMTATGQLAADTKLRSSKYLNNLIEQDHRGVKLRVGPMLGFKRFRSAAATIAGIELLRRIRKGQFNLVKSRLDFSYPFQAINYRGLVILLPQLLIERRRHVMSESYTRTDSTDGPPEPMGTRGARAADTLGPARKS
jgi:transposase-like protein